MPCPHFRGAPDCRCAAVSEPIVPSLHERERFCVGGEARSCPTYQAQDVAGGPISEELYYRLWLAPAQTMHTPDPSVCI